VAYSKKIRHFRNFVGQKISVGEIVRAENFYMGKSPYQMEGLKQSKNLCVAIGQCRNLVKKISDSPKLLKAFQAVFSYMKVTFRIPEIDVETQ
jgi:hypothetical protein